MKLTFGRFLLLVIVISAAGIFTGWILRGEPTPDQTGTLGDAASTSSFLDPSTDGTRVQPLQPRFLEKLGKSVDSLERQLREERHLREKEVQHRNEAEGKLVEKQRGLEETRVALQECLKKSR